MTGKARDLADWVDSHVLVDALQAAGEVLDAADVPLVGRYFWNPKTGQVEPVSITSESKNSERWKTEPSQAKPSAN